MKQKNRSRKKIKILYFYITHSSSELPFNSFNIHIMEIINHANKTNLVEVIGAYEMARVPEKTVVTLRLFHRIKKWLPRLGKDLLAIFSNLPDFIYGFKKMKQVQPDIILFRYNFMNFYQILLKALFKRPLVLEVNSPITDEKIQTKKIMLKGLSCFFEQWSLRHADRVYVVSEELKRIIAQYVPTQKITAIHNGANPKYYEHIQKYKSEKITIGFVGSFQHYHGINALFQAIPSIIHRYNNVEFLLIGAGELYKYFKNMVSKNSIFANHVLLPGHIEYERIPQYLSQMDITFLMDFTDYGSPLKLFEYMIAQTCIIVPDRKTIREILEDRKDALFFRPRDPVDFERALFTVLNDIKYRKKLAHNAYVKVMKFYTWEHTTKKLIALFKSLPISNV